MIRGRKIGSLFGHDVEAVDGELTRDEHDVDFVAGGNSERYPTLVPRGKIYVEDGMTPLDTAATAMHEFVEMTLMSRSGMEYADAHDAANVPESLFRARFEGRSPSIDDAQRWLSSWVFGRS